MSVGQTALNVSAGAVDRWASIFSGIWMLVILVAFSGVVGVVAMPTLAAVLIVAAIGSVRVGQIQSILRTGPNSQVALIATFVATLFLPITAAVGIGVVLSLLLQLNQEAMDLTVMERVPLPEGGFEERPAPPSLPSHQVTVLHVYGSLFYAGAQTLQARLPLVGEPKQPVVVVSVRGRSMLGATGFKILNDYARSLADAGGRLYLSGVEPSLMEQFRPDRAYHHRWTTTAQGGTPADWGVHPRGTPARHPGSRTRACHSQSSALPSASSVSPSSCTRQDRRLNPSTRPTGVPAISTGVTPPSDRAVSAYDGCECGGPPRSGRGGSSFGPVG